MLKRYSFPRFCGKVKKLSFLVKKVLHKHDETLYDKASGKARDKNLESKQTPPRKITKESRVVMTDAAISQSMYGRAGVLVCVPDAYVSRATLSLGA